MKELRLTKGKVALVDDEDFEHLMSLRTPGGWAIPQWCCNGDYAYNGELGLLHRYLMNAPKGVDVDHRDGNKLNCQRNNMRLATKAQNQQNRRTKYAGLSKFKGAHWDRSRGWWIARIRVDGKLKYLGIFDTDKEAGAAYNEAATKYFGDFAALNDLDNTPISELVRRRS